MATDSTSTELSESKLAEPGSVEIRPADEDDVNAILDLKRRVLSEVYAPRYPKVMEGLSQIEEFLCEHPKYLCKYMNLHVAQTENAIVGMVSAARNKIMDLYIDGSMRSKGIGPLLLTAGERVLRSRGVFRARLDVSRDHPELIDFYKRHGWQEGKFHTDPGSDIPLLEMAKRLQTRSQALRKMLALNLPKLALFVFAFAIILMCMGVGKAKMGMEGVFSILAWAPAGIYAGWNISLIPIHEFATTKSRILIFLGVGADVISMAAGSVFGWLIVQVTYFPTGHEIFHPIAGLVIPFFLVIFFDQIARPIVVGIWHQSGVSVGFWLSRWPAIKVAENQG